jgi:hypothetical protein
MTKQDNTMTHRNLLKAAPPTDQDLRDTVLKAFEMAGGKDGVAGSA